MGALRSGWAIREGACFAAGLLCAAGIAKDGCETILLLYWPLAPLRRADDGGAERSVSEPYVAEGSVVEVPVIAPEPSLEKARVYG
jgi:hypothetical protein